MTFLMAATAGLLVFLGLDTLAEALEFAGKVPSAFQGIGLIGIGSVATFLLLDAISKRQTEITGNETDRRLAVAFMIAIGIGFHNLGEGLPLARHTALAKLHLAHFSWLASSSKTSPRDLALLHRFCVTDLALAGLPLWV